MQCNHKTSHERTWYPGGEAAFRPTPVCNKCRTLKNISMDRGKNIGFYINILTDIKRHFESVGFKISDVQVRLILKELKKTDGFDDLFWIKRSVQKSIFIKSVQKYVPLSTAFIERFIQLS